MIRYEIEVHEAKTDDQLDKIRYAIRRDLKLSNRDRNTLFIVLANRRKELGGKDGQATGPGLAASTSMLPEARSASVPANPGEGQVLAHPPQAPSGEFSLSEAKEIWDRLAAIKWARFELALERAIADLVGGAF